MPAGVQRRRDPRFRLRHEHDFYCRGRHKNGENYLFDIKDISDGGCALMTKTPNLKFLSHNAEKRRTDAGGIWRDHHRPGGKECHYYHP
jgi:c-di-GMP-binding flagellar brake protein YcgR